MAHATDPLAQPAPAGGRDQGLGAGSASLGARGGTGLEFSGHAASAHGVCFPLLQVRHFQDGTPAKGAVLLHALARPPEPVLAVHVVVCFPALRQQRRQPGFRKQRASPGPTLLGMRPTENSAGGNRAGVGRILALRGRQASQPCVSGTQGRKHLLSRPASSPPGMCQWAFSPVAPLGWLERRAPRCHTLQGAPQPPGSSKDTEGRAGGFGDVGFSGARPSPQGRAQEPQGQGQKQDPGQERPEPRQSLSQYNRVYTWEL